MKQPLISYDLDGVLARFNVGAAHAANDALGLKLSADYEPSDWEWSQALDKEGWNRVWDRINSTPDFWLNLPSYADQVLALWQYQHIHPDHRTAFITSRAWSSDDVVRQSKLWLAGEGLQGEFHWVKNSSYKKDLIRELKVDFSIDDLTSTVQECNQIKGHRAYLMDRPWNRGPESRLLPRVFSIEDFHRAAFTGLSYES